MARTLFHLQPAWTISFRHSTITTTTATSIAVAIHLYTMHTVTTIVHPYPETGMYLYPHHTVFQIYLTFLRSPHIHPRMLDYHRTITPEHNRIAVLVRVVTSVCPEGVADPANVVLKTLFLTFKNIFTISEVFLTYF